MFLDEKLGTEGNDKLNSGVCPKCGDTRIIHGPQAGMAENICCGNGHRFWFSPPFTGCYQGIIRVDWNDSTYKAYF